MRNKFCTCELIYQFILNLHKCVFSVQIERLLIDVLYDSVCIISYSINDTVFFNEE